MTMKTSVTLATVAAALTAALASDTAAQTAPAAPAAASAKLIPVWVFKPKVSPYVAPNRPIWRISELLAQHKGQADWSQTVLKDQWFVVRYISQAPRPIKRAVSHATGTHPPG